MPKRVGVANTTDALWPIIGSVGTLAVKVMAGTYQGLYLVGNKRAQTIRAVQIVDSAGRHTTIRVSDYISRGMPEYKTLPWQEDLVFKSADAKSQSN